MEGMYLSSFITLYMRHVASHMHMYPPVAAIASQNDSALILPQLCVYSNAIYAIYIFHFRNWLRVPLQLVT